MDARWRVRHRDLLERVVLRRRRAGHGHAPEQHARRGGPQPRRLPPLAAGRARAEHDGADGGAARRGGRGGARARPARTGSARRSCRRSPAWSTAGCARRRPSTRPRLHVEGDLVDAEPGVDAAALDALERGRLADRCAGSDRNLYFGGVQAVARDRGRRGVKRWRRSTPRWCRRRRRRVGERQSVGRWRSQIWDRRSDEIPAVRREPVAMAERLSSLDGSFLRVETANAHMHVAWAALLEPRPERPRPTLAGAPAVDRGPPRAARRGSAASLGFAPPGMGEPFWVDDDDFIDRAPRHAALRTRMTGPTSGASRRSATARCRSPLDRASPLWRVYLAPRARRRADGDGRQVPPRAGRRPLGRRGGDAPFRRDPGQRAGSGLRDGGRSRCRGPRGSRSARWRGGRRVAARRARGGEDRRRPARGRRAHLRHACAVRRSPSATNCCGRRRPRSSTCRSARERTLVRFRAPFDDVKAIKRAAGVTVNDVCLAVVAGALRETALARGEAPRPLRAMVPVSLRADAEADCARQPHLARRSSTCRRSCGSPGARLAKVHADTTAFKRSGKAEGAGDGVRRARPAAGCAAHRRGADGRLEARLQPHGLEHPRPGVPALRARRASCRAPGRSCRSPRTTRSSIGIFSYREHLHFGLYADPHALPDVGGLPGRSSARSRAERSVGAGRAGGARALRGRALAQDELRRRRRSAAREGVTLVGGPRRQVDAPRGRCARTVIASPAGVLEPSSPARAVAGTQPAASTVSRRAAAEPLAQPAVAVAEGPAEDRQ